MLSERQKGAPEYITDTKRERQTDTERKKERWREAKTDKTPEQRQCLSIDQRGPRKQERKKDIYIYKVVYVILKHRVCHRKIPKYNYYTDILNSLPLHRTQSIQSPFCVPKSRPLR